MSSMINKLSGFLETLWLLLCLGTLGFPDKYLERLQYFEDLVPESGDPWTQPKTFSDRGDTTNGQKTMRQRQQEEWDRLNIATSVITATSAAALAIQSGSQVYWLVTAFYSAAFGMSLQCLILITYTTVSAGQPIRPVAFMMALPAILTTYSSLALLAGLSVMILKGPGESVATRGGLYIAVAVVPVGLTFLCLCFAFVFCEVGIWMERKGRRSVAKKAMDEKAMAEKARAGPTSQVWSFQAAHP